MDKAIKLVVSLLAGVTGLAIFTALILGAFYVTALVLTNFVVFVKAVIIGLLIAGAWKIAYDILFGEYPCR